MFQLPPGAALFNAARGTFLSRPNPAALNPGTAPMSLCGWIQLHSFTGKGQAIVAKWDASTLNRSWALHFYPHSSPAGFRFTFSGDGINDNGPVVVPPGGVQLGAWYFVLGTWDGVVQSISVNGGPPATLTPGWFPFSGVAPLTVGYLNASLPDQPNIPSYADASIARVGVWIGRCLSADDQAQLFVRSLSTHYATLSAMVKGDLSAWYDLGEPADSPRLDSTANGFDLDDHNTVGLAAGPPWETLVDSFLLNGPQGNVPADLLIRG